MLEDYYCLTIECSYVKTSNKGLQNEQFVIDLVVHIFINFTIISLVLFHSLFIFSDTL